MWQDKRYFYDDTKALGDLVVQEWKLSKPSTVIYYKESTDPNTHDYRQDEVAVFINEGKRKVKQEG